MMKKELVNLETEFFQYEEKEKKRFKDEQSIRSLWDNSKMSTISVTGIFSHKERTKG